MLKNFIFHGLILLSCTTPFIAGAADTVCAEVQISIKQEVSLERQAFEAHMRIKNGAPDVPITDIGVELIFTDENGNNLIVSSDPNDTSPDIRFFYGLESDKTNIPGSVDNNTAVVEGGTSADIYWLIIPTHDSKNTSQNGKLYFLGAKLKYKIGGIERETTVVPDYIYVLPTPMLTLDYFLPETGNGDDPNTQKIEASVPFTLGLRIKNNGHGIATSLSIGSAQPKIIDNVLGLLIGFTILQTDINGMQSNSGFKVDFGNLEPLKLGSARWKLETTLDGRFKDFTVDLKHADAVGGKLTSLVDLVNTHTLIHDVVVDIPGRDQVYDFLVSGAPYHKLYDSQNLEPESVIDCSSSAGFTKATVHEQGTVEIWNLDIPAHSNHIYAKVSDPYNGEKIIKKVTRSDGKNISNHNFWTGKTSAGDGNWNYHIGLFDSNTTGSYSVVYNAQTNLNHPPVIQYITDKTVAPNSQISFIVEASDEDGDDLVISAAGIPQGALFLFQEKRGGLYIYVFDWAPSDTQIGEHSLTFKTFDGSLNAERKMIITVGNGGYSLGVENGTGAGSYPVGAIITISADAPPDGYFFDCWTGDDISCLNDIYKSDAVLIMPSKDLIVSASYKTLDPRTPYLHWAMDETQGNTVIDYSPSGYTGNIEGNAVWTTEGAVGNALNFDGIENYVSSNCTELPNKWTVAAWIKTDELYDDTKTVSIINKDDSFQIELNRPDEDFRNSIKIKINDQWYSASFGTIYPETWYHLLVLYDEASLKTYKNGVLTATIDLPEGRIANTSSPLILGKNSEADDLFNGSIDDIRIYDHVLDNTEINELLDMGNVLIAADDSFSINEDTVLNVDIENGLLVNDKAPDNNPLIVSVVSNPENGSLTLNSDGSFEYIPNAHFNGTDSFVYKITDVISYASAQAEVKIFVNSIDDAPISKNDIYKTGWNEILKVEKNNSILANDTIIDGENITAVLVSGVKNGTLVLNPDGSFEYSQEENFTGSDSFIYKVNNGILNSEPAEVLIVVDKTVSIENAESRNTDSWDVYDKSPMGSVKIVTDSDDPNNYVVSLFGGKTSTGYRYTFTKAVTSAFKVQWRMKYSEPYVVYFSCQTINGHRYIYYTNSDSDLLDKGRYVHHGLDSDTVSGKWVTVRRDLEKDLLDAQPDNRLISIDAFLIRGSGFIDDISSLEYVDKDCDLIPDYIEVAVGLDPEDSVDGGLDLDGDGLTNYEECIHETNMNNDDTDSDRLPDFYEIYVSKTNPLKGDTDEDGVSDDNEDLDNDSFDNFYEYSMGIDPLKASVQGDTYVYDQTIYDVADDDAIDCWDVYDNIPEGWIDVITDPNNRENSVVKLSTDGGTKTGFRYTFQIPNVKEFKVQWRMKYSESCVIYFSCMTTAGHRYIYYDNSDKTNLGIGRYIHHGLDKKVTNGEWAIVQRDLQRDLLEAQPGNKIISINAFLIRGNGLMDDITTRYYVDIDGDSLPDEFEIDKGLDPVNPDDAMTDMDGDGISNIDEFTIGTDINKIDTDNDGFSDFYEITVIKTDPLTMDTDGDGVPDGNEDSDDDGFTDLEEFNAGTNPFHKTIQAENYTYEITMHENADAGDTGLWDVYDDSPTGTIENITDPDNHDNNVIALSGAKTATGYRCTFAESVADTFKVQWRMKYNEPYVIYFSCQTTDEHRYIYYTSSDSDLLDKGRYVHHGLGSDTISDEWITICRDLEKDLLEAQPDNRLISIDAFLIRGSGLVDDILSIKYIIGD
jgi:hypothetical protein